MESQQCQKCGTKNKIFLLTCVTCGLVICVKCIDPYHRQEDLCPECFTRQLVSMSCYEQFFQEDRTKEKRQSKQEWGKTQKNEFKLLGYRQNVGQHIPFQATKNSKILVKDLYPRIPCSRLKCFFGQRKVTMVGEVMTIGLQSLQMKVDKNIDITVIPNSSFNLKGLRPKYLQVRGALRFAQFGIELFMDQYCDFGQNFNLNNYNEVLELLQSSELRDALGI